MRNNPYTEIVEIIRGEGAAYNPLGITTGKVLAGGKISIDGTTIDEDIYILSGVDIEVGDTVAVQQLDEDTLILGKVVPYDLSV